MHHKTWNRLITALGAIWILAFALIMWANF